MEKLLNGFYAYVKEHWHYRVEQIHIQRASDIFQINLQMLQYQHTHYEF